MQTQFISGTDPGIALIFVYPFSSLKRERKSYGQPYKSNIIIFLRKYYSKHVRLGMKFSEYLSDVTFI